ncbi:hypothetical protein M445_05610 [Vibrio owensii 47666-1]|uniref:hypothetical protein n=1 Tax=Vibrio owensii TaxID=696485 RepID=UPI00058511A5|nr:hypothetical protein [Vibrio owensii]KIF48815.1 hypothetical protein M445_05610 [Vibrio owensii 47666-1]
MFSVIISDFEPIRNYIKNSIRQYVGVNNVISMSEIKELNNKKVDSLLSEFGHVCLFFDLDRKTRLSDKKRNSIRKNITDVMENIERKSNITIYVVGCEESLLENRDLIINQNIQSYQMLAKPFNGMQLNNFISSNLKQISSLSKSNTYKMDKPEERFRLIAC